jgi:hypothetical protein
MGLDQIANIAEISAAVLVVASLIYVGYQVKESRMAVRAATAQARTDLGIQLISSRYTSDIAEVLVMSLDSPESLTKVDKFKLKSFFSAHVRFSHNLYYQHKQKLLDDYFLFGVARTTAYWIRNYPWAVDEWTDVQKYMPSDFVTFINTELERHPSKYEA